MPYKYDMWTRPSQLDDWDRFKLLAAALNMVRPEDLKPEHIGYVSDTKINPQMSSVRWPDKALIDWLILANGTKIKDHIHSARRYMRQQCIVSSSTRVETGNEIIWDINFPMVVLSGEEFDKEVVLLPPEEWLAEHVWMQYLADMALDPIICDMWPWSEGMEPDWWEPETVQIKCYNRAGDDLTEKFIGTLVTKASNKGLTGEDDEEVEKMKDLLVGIPHQQ